MRGKSYLLGVIMTFSVVLGVTNAHAIPKFSEGVHSTFVFFHIVGVIIFMGNIVVSALWMKQAGRTREPRVLQSAARSVMRADRVFTMPGILLILITGILTTAPHGGFPGKAWIELALMLFILSGVIWVTALLRLQKRMVELADVSVKYRSELGEPFYRTLKRWSMWGGIATLLPFVALVLMIFKPTLWR